MNKITKQQAKDIFDAWWKSCNNKYWECTFSRHTSLYLKKQDKVYALLISYKANQLEENRIEYSKMFMVVTPQLFDNPVEYFKNPKVVRMSD